MKTKKECDSMFGKRKKGREKMMDDVRQSVGVLWGNACVHIWITIDITM